jgi:hypothetical protein
MPELGEVREAAARVKEWWRAQGELLRGDLLLCPLLLPEVYRLEPKQDAAELLCTEWRELAGEVREEWEAYKAEWARAEWARARADEDEGRRRLTAGGLPNEELARLLRDLDGGGVGGMGLEGLDGDVYGGLRGDIGSGDFGGGGSGGVGPSPLPRSRRH